MTPEQIAKDSEHSQQSALFCWAAEYANKVDCRLHLLFAIPNGDQRGDGTEKGAMIAGARLKAEGLRSGVPDIFLPVAIDQGKAWIDLAESNGLFIEMKKPALKTDNCTNGCTDKQLEWHRLLREQGYCVIVCYTWEKARDCILAYLRGELIKVIK